MRLPSPGRGICLAAAHFSLTLAVILLFSSNTVAQHSGGGGSSGGSSSSGGGGGGGSHGGGSSGGSSSASSGGHSSGASNSHGSSGHSSGPTSSHVGSSHSGPSHSWQAGGTHPVREPNAGMRGKTGTEKRGLFSILRHPFRKPQPKPEPKLTADLRRPICLRGPCRVCRPGRTGVGRCGGTVVDAYARRSCAGGVWNGGGCFLQNRFPYDCNAERVAMERQAQRMQAAEGAQQRACSTGSGQDCSDRSSAAPSETSVYRTLQAQYRACQQRSLGVNPFGHSAGAGYGRGLSFDPLEFELDYR